MESNNQINKMDSDEQPQPLPVRKRKRIPIFSVDAKKTLSVQDGINYKKNRCVHKAAFSHTVEKGYHVDLWFAEHYHDRHLKGDEKGRRDGIEPKVVQSLVERALKHMFHYSAMYSTFKLINFPEQADARTAAIVLQELQPNGKTLNVVVEVHLVDICKYEITVKTAMCDEQFNLFIGQYVIEIEGDTSILKRYVNGKLVNV